jgi:hypothetical protein
LANPGIEQKPDAIGEMKPPESFGYIRRHRHRRPSNLTRQAVHLTLREVRRQSLRQHDKPLASLPHLEILEGPNHRHANLNT